VGHEKCKSFQYKAPNEYLKALTMKILMLNSAVYTHGLADVASIHSGSLALEFAAKHHVYVVGQMEQSEPARDNLRVARISVHLTRSLSLAPEQKTVMTIVHRVALVLSILHFTLVIGHKERFDVIYARHGLPSLAGSLLRRLFGIPMVVELNGFLDSDAEALHWPKLTRYLIKLIEILVFHSADAVVTVTKEGKKKLIARFSFEEELVTVVSNGVDTDLFRPTNRNDARRECNIGPNIVVSCPINPHSQFG
jgi:glycosyltransferase involved in cell wall biosynthesis